MSETFYKEVTCDNCANSIKLMAVANTDSSVGMPIYMSGRYESMPKGWLMLGGKNVCPTCAAAVPAFLKPNSVKAVVQSVAKSVVI